MKKTGTAVLLVSGGLDSAANLALAPAIGFHAGVGLTVDYGQRSAAREIACARALCARFKIEHVTCDLRGFSKLVSGKSALLEDSAALPSPADLDALSVIEKSARAVWVPNRNGVLLSLGAALAEARGFDAVLVGFNAEEAVTFADNTPAYMDAMTGSLRFSTANGVEIASATAALTKEEIVRKLTADFPFELLWSCYRGGEKHCGECESCLRLRRALARGLGPSASEAIRARIFGWPS
ncbi:MAG: 7-cyano-7-deazaguanine synthase [Deltaproteobacteria bacterium]|nr:7-cyano-7-deazaguanine synthase [Deltaproteobacteria bacterium]